MVCRVAVGNNTNLCGPKLVPQTDVFCMTLPFYTQRGHREVKEGFYAAGRHVS